MVSNFYASPIVIAVVWIQTLLRIPYPDQAFYQMVEDTGRPSGSGFPIKIRCLKQKF
jgi:hypothetical protein